MSNDDIERLLAYERWAHARVLEAASAVSDEQYGATHGPGGVSIRGTLSHIVAAAWIWAERLSGRNPEAAPAWASGAPISELRERLDAVNRELVAHATGERELQRMVRFRYLSGAEDEFDVGTILAHVVNHSTYHRGQVAMLMRFAGATPQSTDRVLFEKENRFS